MLGGEAALDAAEEETADPDPDDKTEEELNPPVLAGVWHCARFIPIIEICCPEV
jgi:hypothetical protein